MVPVQIYLIHGQLFENKLLLSPGPGCSKLTTSLVNVSLKFQTLISQICQYFLLKKCTTKNIGVFGYKVVKHLTS